ncbi:hypothetical protein KM043_012758 [Ampulex compressa]|nr:hypothetical protein KM043_012758 [Ampulex compressa]
MTRQLGLVPRCSRASCASMQHSARARTRKSCLAYARISSAMRKPFRPSTWPASLDLSSRDPTFVLVVRPWLATLSSADVESEGGRFGQRSVRMEEKAWRWEGRGPGVR